MESYAPSLTSWNLVFSFFPFKEKLYTPVCSTVPGCKPKAEGQGIAIRAKVEQKGRV